MPEGKSASKSPVILPEELSNPNLREHSPRSSSTPTPPTTQTAPSDTRTSASSRPSASIDFGFVKPARRASQNDERLKELPLVMLTSGSESGASALHVNSSDLPSLDKSPDTQTSVPLASQDRSQGAGSPQARPYEFYIKDDSQRVEDLNVLETQSPSFGPHKLQDIHEDQTEEEAGETSFIRTQTKDSSYSEHNSLSSSNKTSDSSFNKSQSSSHSQQSNGSSGSQGRRSTGSSHSQRSNGSYGSHGSHGSQSRRGHYISSVSPGTASSNSQMSNMSFTNVKTSTPRETQQSNHSTPSDPSPSNNQVSPLGTYSHPGSLPFSIQEIQPHHRSPTATVQRSREAQRLSQERIARNRVAVHDDNATQPLDDFGPDIRLDDIEAVFGPEEEAAYTQRSQISADRGFDTDDERAAVGDITSQDIRSPLGQSPSPTRPHKRSQEDDDEEALGSQVIGPVLDEYLSSDEEGAHRSAGDGSALNLHLTQDFSSSNASGSLLFQPMNRPRSTARNDTGQPFFPLTTHPSSPTKSAQLPELPAITQKYSGSDRPRTPSPPLAKDFIAGTLHKSRSVRSPRPSSSQNEDIPSSQNSGSVSSYSGSSRYNLQMGQAAAELKRRKILSGENKQPDIRSSVEDDFWGSSEPLSQTKEVSSQEEPGRRPRSRSISQDIASFPNDPLPEIEAVEPFVLKDKGKGKAKEKDNEPTPASEGGPSSRTRSAASPLKQSPKPRTSPPSQLRRKGSERRLAPTSPTRRNPVRRLHSSTEALRSYKTSDPVWARWKKSYYAGIVQDQKSNRYNIHFLDGDNSVCEGSDMRPLKLQLGASVMAWKNYNSDYPATVEGIQLASVLEQSRVDVRFEDDTKANLTLQNINLTPEMLEKLDRTIDWDMEIPRAAADELPLSQTELPSTEASSSLTRQPSTGSAPPSTPRKARARGLSRHESTGSLTPNRRGKNDTLAAIAPGTPTRRVKDGIFKGLEFVLSLSGRKALDDMPQYIKDNGGTIWKDFSEAINSNRGLLPPNVLFISYAHLRTPKYMEALALNVPRLSHRWIETCIEARQLHPYQNYKLPTGFSRELETVVSSDPVGSHGIFDGLLIGICGKPRLEEVWSKPLKAAGATVVTVSAKTGPMMCNYIVFSDPQEYEEYCKTNDKLPSLADEWLIQCFINQRIVSIGAHPSYTDLEKLSVAPTTSGSSSS
ncbi:hypothetical protein FBU30_002128 [Linnemannia zychae]|nr:hypothetical protein FBU30_002128 [Linnemannia zychae]